MRARVRGSGGNQFYEWVRTGAVRRLPRHQPESCHRCGGGGVRATQSGGAGEVPDTHRLIPQSWQASSSARNNILSVSVGVRRGTPYLLRRTGGGATVFPGKQYSTQNRGDYGIFWEGPIFNAEHTLQGAARRCKAPQGAKVPAHPSAHLITHPRRA